MVWLVLWLIMVLVIDVSHVGCSCVVGSWLVGEGKNLYRLMSARGVYIVLYITYVFVASLC